MRDTIKQRMKLRSYAQIVCSFETHVEKIKYRCLSYRLKIIKSKDSKFFWLNKVIKKCTISIYGCLGEE